MIPFLTRIDNEMAQTQDPSKRAELLAERASYLVRTGDFDEADRILTFLRENYGDGRDVRVSVWIMFVEGLGRFFKDVDPASRDRIQRALVLSAAANQCDLTSLCAVWLAHIEFNRSRFEASLKLLEQGLDCGSTLPATAALRAAIVLADASMHSCCIDAARHWYEIARQRAVDLGDQATLAAIIFNKAALSLSQLRLGALTGAVDNELVRFVSMQIASARSFHTGTSNTSLVQLILACEARVQLLQCDYSGAASKLECLLADREIAFGFSSDRPLLELEYAQCLAELGSIEESRSMLRGLQGGGDSMTTDDRLVFLTTYARLARRLSLEPEDSINAETVAACRYQYEAEVRLLKDGLDRLSAFVSSVGLRNSV